MSDVITDIELRSTIKNIILNAVGKKTEFLEAEHTKALSTMFLKLYRNITDFSNKAAIRNLYQEYEQMVKQYLNEKNI